MMNFRAFLAPLRRWWWLVLGTTVIACISSFLLLREVPSIYQARATLMVGRTMAVLNPNSNELFLGRQLARVYADMAERAPIRDAVQERLGLEELPEYEALVLPDSQLIEIVVTDTIPERSQAVAEELSRQLVLASPGNPESADQDRARFVDEQLSYLEVKIQETQEEIAQRQTELAEMVSARQIEETQLDLIALQDKLNTLQANYAALLSTTREEAINTITVFEPPTLPDEPVGPKVGMLVAISGAMGLLLGSGASYLLEYMDDTLKSVSQITEGLDLPILGYIPKVKALDGKAGGPPLALQSDPDSATAEAFRLLRANLLFACGESIPRIIQITSLGAAEGKTTVAINLAASLERADMRVLLVDSDLRRPEIHRALELSNDAGLGDAAMDGLDLASVMQRVDSPPISVITSGSRVEDPTEIMGSERYSHFLDTLRASADFTILDSPPLLVADALVLASKVDGVLLVIEPGRVSISAARAIIEQLANAKAKLLGVVVNRIPRGSGFPIGEPHYLSYLSRTDRRPEKDEKGTREESTAGPHGV